MAPADVIGWLGCSAELPFVSFVVAEVHGMPKLRSVRAALLPALIRPHGCADRAFEAGRFVITVIDVASDMSSVLLRIDKSHYPGWTK